MTSVYSALPQATDTSGTVRRRFAESVLMFFVAAFSLIVLVYVGFGEGKRTYGEFHIARVTTQAGIIKNAMETFLRDGLPIRQFAGFNQLAEPIVEGRFIDAIIAYDSSGREVFRATDHKLGRVLHPPPEALSATTGSATVFEGYTYVTMPLRSRFEAVGTLLVATSDDVASQPVRTAFLGLAQVAVAMAFAFALLVIGVRSRLGFARNTWLHVAYAGVFLTMSGVVIWTLVSLYSEGAQDKARVLADMLARRIGEIVAYKLELRDIEGIEHAFAEYRKLNPDIDAVALVVGDRTQIHTDPRKIGSAWTPSARAYAYINDIATDVGQQRIGVAVEVPREIVYRQVARSVKNFAAVFIASGFLAGLFLQVAASVQGARRAEVDSSLEAATCKLLRERAALGTVKPMFFVAVFLEHLTYSFLPQHMQELAVDAGLAASFASAPFMVYYLFFALSLIPSGHFSQHFGPRLSMNGGLILAGVGLLALVLPIGFWGALVARAAAGIGQGMLFIGVQTYILATASPENRTQGNGIIVFGFQGGMISGMAIGSLLVTYLGDHGVFELAGLLAFATALYGVTVVPDRIASLGPAKAFHQELRTLFYDVARVLRHNGFIRAMLLIGVPAKATLTGVITFALPLLLTRSQYRQEDIGQIVMLYAIGVVVSSHYVARLVDRSGRTGPVIAWGAAASGIAMLAIGLQDWNAPTTGSWATWIVVLGVMAIGIAHGCVNAPVVTHIAELDLSRIIGVSSVTATYRFLERAGHIAGPIIVGQLFMSMGTTPVVIAMFGAVISILAIMFLLPAGGGKAKAELETMA